MAAILLCTLYKPQADHHTKSFLKVRKPFTFLFDKFSPVNLGLFALCEPRSLKRRYMQHIVSKKKQLVVLPD